MVEKFSVEFDRVSAEERADLWADAVRPLFFVSPLGADKSEPATLGRSWLLDRMVFCEAAFGGQVFQRTKSHCQADIADAVVVQYYRFGENWGEIEGQPIKIGTGEVNITDYGRPHQSRSNPTHVRSFYVAHDVLGYDPSVHPPTMRFGTDTIVGHILHHSIETVFDSLDRITPAEAPTVANALIGLLRGLLLNGAAVAQTTPSFSKARARAIRAYIDQTICSKRLNAKTICAQFNVSRSTLYRAFEEDGGIERYILGRRLEAALKALAFGPAARGAVTNAVETFGFCTTSYFSREFRRRFGFSPSEVVGTWNTDAALGDVVAASAPAGRRETLEAFLRQL